MKPFEYESLKQIIADFALLFINFQKNYFTIKNKKASLLLVIYHGQPLTISIFCNVILVSAVAAIMQNYTNGCRNRLLMPSFFLGN